jgi:hypothetical protein
MQVPWPDGKQQLFASPPVSVIEMHPFRETHGHEWRKAGRGGGGTHSIFKPITSISSYDDLLEL